MRPRLALSLLLPLSIAIPSLAQQATRSRPVSVDHVSSGDTAQSLPIRRVALYKNGVGFFEHAGTVRGTESVTIDFTTAQLNDVLQTLTAIDLGGGRVQGAGYNSTTPLDQQLKALPLSLAADPTAADLYTAVRGARVEVSGDGATFIGRILNVELRDTAPSKGSGGESSPTVQRQFLTVVSDAGTVRTIELTGHTAVRLLDRGVQGGLERYLQTLAANHQDGLRHLTLTDTGSAAPRELRVSYISEVPVWKCTYRLLFESAARAGQSSTGKTATLQGWAVVDNTVGADWNDVQLSLIAGAPQSFIQPISQPTYTRRPEIALPGEAMLTPQTHESGDDAKSSGTGSGGGMGIGGGTYTSSGIQGAVTDAAGATIPNAQVVATGPGGRFTGMTDGAGHYTLPVSVQGRYSLQISSPGFNTLATSTFVGSDLHAQANATLQVGSASESVNVSAAAPMQMNIAGPVQRGRIQTFAKIMAPPPPPSYEEAASASITPQTTTSRFDDYFEYKLTEPVTIRKNESALVPILQAKVSVDPVTLWSPSEPQPLRALWVTNTSGLTLDRGSFSILENGNFSGQGLLDPIHPGERRLLSYAADQAVRVSTEPSSEPATRRVQQISIARGVMTVRSAEAFSQTYLIHNAAPEARTVIVEQPRRAGWTLDDGTKPEETTPNAYRFRVAAQSGETARLHIGERHTIFSTYQIANIANDQLMLILRQDGNPPSVVNALQPVIAAKQHLSEIEAQVEQRDNRIQEITQDQNRLRENLKALKGTPEERALAKRYTDELNRQEDQLAALRKELDDLHSQQQAASDALSAQIQALQVDATL